MNGHCPGRGNPTREQNPAYELLQPIIPTRRIEQGLNNVDDQLLWNLGFTRLNDLYSGYSRETELALALLLTRYCQAKEALAAVIAEIDASSVCHQCGGQCCLNGKYRINVCDSLVLIARETIPSVNFIQKPVCPYGSQDGCSMEPGLRPVDCILFICDAINEKLSPQSRTILVAGEQGLRECIEQASRLTGERLRTPLLLWAEEQKTINPKV